MRVKELLKKSAYECKQGNLETEVGGICYDSRKIKAGDLFVCLKGASADGHDFLPAVVEAGARAVVVEREVAVLESVTVIRVESTRLALAEISAAWFGYPTEGMTTIGVTGTKGKTTTTYMIKAILEAAGHKVGLVGTNGAMVGNIIYPTKNTTPESYELQQYFREMRDAGCTYMVMEVSSQGIMLDRVGGFSFDYGIFTNLAPDHIGAGEHASFEEYLAYKSRIFQMCRVGLGNRDDEHWEEVEKGHTCELYTYSVKGTGDFTAENIRYRASYRLMGMAFDVKGKRELSVELGIPGRFNVSNAMAAIGVCSLIGVADEAIKKALRSVSVNGRMEIVYASDEFSVIVDYAHNEVSMESLLSTLREYYPKRLVCLFGCGGNRSRLRRYGMGEISGAMADLTIITADNSRFEEVEDILADIKKGLLKTEGDFIQIEDRREAIHYAVKNAEKGDLIVIIGKGHEDYQEIKGVRYPFSDRAVVQEALAETVPGYHAPAEDEKEERD